MADVQVITSNLYYSINDDLSFVERSSFEEAKTNSNLKFILHKKIGYNPFPTNSGAVIQNYAASLHLLDTHGAEYDTIGENNWELKLRGFGLTYGYAYTTMWIKFTDSFGFEVEETFGISVEDFIKAYTRFQRLNKFEGYKFAKISIENESLKTENEELKARTVSLIEENNRLKSRLSAMA